MSAVTSIDGIASQAIETPETPQDLAKALAAASRAQLQTVVSGGGTKLHWGRPPARVDLLISTSRLNAIVAHRHGDLTATIQAGAPLIGVNQQLATHGQCLPIDTPFDGTTIGGMVATNDAGPLRHRYGTPRDLLIGVTLALTDGRIVKAGGHVVKNVAGYDLGRFMSGSFGTLAAIVDATFKLLPIPAASGTVVGRYANPMELAKGLAAIRGTTLEPTALDLHVSPPECRLLVRYATSPAATDAQIAATRALAGGDATVVQGDEERVLWTDHERGIWTRNGAIVRLSWLPAAFADAAAALERTGLMTGITGELVELVGRAGVGAGLVRIDGDDAAQIAAIRHLRGQAATLDHVVVLRASRAVKAAVDVWAMPRQLEPIYRSLKRTFDPAGIMNAGRGPI